MGVLALHVLGKSTYPSSLLILVVVALVAAGYFIFREYREYLSRRFKKRN